ncbi:MAG: succinate dehydrogenase cytochrome b subunit [Myxococcota bacterium]|nr:succinate dehydrogenase cytochrome b subunit [Myxococcota bacterium]
MAWLVRTFSNPIGQKVLVALTGLGLVGFLVSHLLGNLNIFRGEGAINDYAHTLHGLPGFALIEIGLLLCFLVHIALVFNLTRINRAARGKQYTVRASKQTGSMGRAMVSTYMGVSGIILLVFVVVHIGDFRLMRGGYDSLYTYTHEVLGSGWKAALYMAGSAVVGWHLWHGFQSSFRSLGLGHAKYSPLIERFGAFLSIALTLGFISIPAWIFFIKGGQ